MWVLLGPGDAALVPSPSYPIHIFAPLFAGASAREIPMSTDGNFIERVHEAYEYSWPKPRVIVLSFPHNPTTATVELDFFQQVVDFAREHEVVVVHDNAYAELGFDGFQPPSILQADGAKECAVELYSMTKSFSMAGWRVAFLAGNAEVVQALAKLKSYLDYGTFQPIQIAATVTMNEAPDTPDEVQAVYQRRRDVLIDGLHRMGWDVPRPTGHDVRLGADPRALRATWARSSSPRCWSARRRWRCPRAWASGPGGEGYVRFALIENEQRTQQALRNLRRTLTKLG